MTTHKYASGDYVTLNLKVDCQAIGPFKVTDRLTSDIGAIDYRVRSVDEDFDRVVEEFQIGGWAETSTRLNALSQFSTVTRKLRE